jgi:GTP cyclohydrolase I
LVLSNSHKHGALLFHLSFEPCQILGKDPEASEVLATPEKGAAVEEPVEEGAEEDEEAVAAREAKKGKCHQIVMQEIDC